MGVFEVNVNVVVRDGLVAVALVEQDNIGHMTNVGVKRLKPLY